jgi:two-component system, NarL family, sensor kinase
MRAFFCNFTLMPCPHRQYAFMKTPIALILFSIISFEMLAQSAPVDSIESRLPSLTGVARAKALFEITSYYLRANRDKAARYVQEATLTRKSSGDDAVNAYCFLSEGMFKNSNGQIDSATVLLEAGKDAAIRSNNYNALTKAYNALSYLLVSRGKAAKGLEYLYAGLKVVDKSPDKEMELKLRTNITWAHLELKQYRECVNSGLKNLSAMSGTSFEWMSLITFNNIAVAYGALNKLDSAKYYIQKGLAAAEKSNDSQTTANGHFILGTIYAEAGQFKLAEAEYLKAKPYRDKVGNPFFIASDLYAMAELYSKMGEYKKGIQAGEEALKMAKLYDITLKYEGAYFSLAQNYNNLGDYKNASKYYHLYAQAKDTVYKHSSSEAIAEMSTKYETEKKEKQIAQQKAVLTEQRAAIQLTYFIVAGLSGLLILLAIIFVLVRSRLKKKQQLLVTEKELYIREAQIQASIQSQERERKRFAQDLHDGMGQLISALRLALHNVNKETSLDERISVVEKGENILNDMHNEIRSIAFNLMPQTLVKHGLVPALKEMGDRINGSNKVTITVTSFDIPVRLNEITEVSLYRIIQEWVNNVLKYSSAKQIQVQLTGYEEEINIIIEDNGIGFDVLNLENSNGNGWKNIKSRLSLIKGSIEIDSRQGFTGITVVIRIPLLQESLNTKASVVQISSGSVSQPTDNQSTVHINTH